jgi:hypothetical protein
MAAVKNSSLLAQNPLLLMLRQTGALAGQSVSYSYCSHESRNFLHNAMT